MPLPGSATRPVTREAYQATPLRLCDLLLRPALRHAADGRRSSRPAALIPQTRATRRHGSPCELACRAAPRSAQLSAQLVESCAELAGLGLQRPARQASSGDLRRRVPTRTETESRGAPRVATCGVRGQRAGGRLEWRLAACADREPGGASSGDLRRARTESRGALRPTRARHEGLPMDSLDINDAGIGGLVARARYPGHVLHSPPAFKLASVASRA